MKNIELYYLKETVAQAVVKNIVWTMCLVFCVYIGRDSTFWTFITGGCFLFAICSRLIRFVNDSKNVFKNKQELLDFVNNMED